MGKAIGTNSRQGREKLGKMPRVNKNLNVLESYYLRDPKRTIRANISAFDVTGVASFKKDLEQIREKIELNEVESARTLIANCYPSNLQEQLELDLENARCCYLNNEVNECVIILEKIITIKDMTIETRMSAMEMLGRAYFKIGKIESAITYLSKTVFLLESLNSSIAGFIAGAHLAKVLSEIGDFKRAKNTIEFLRLILVQIEDDQIWLNRRLLIIRAEFHYHRLQKNLTDAEVSLRDSYVIAKWLGNPEMVERCMMDFEALKLAPNEIKNIMFLAKINVLFIFSPPKVVRLDKRPDLAKIVQVLIKGPIEIGKLFEEVSGDKFVEKIHLEEMYTVLSVLRSKLPENSLKIESGIVRLF